MSDPKNFWFKKKSPVYEANPPLGWSGSPQDKIILRIEERNGYFTSMQMADWQNQLRRQEMALESARMELERKEKDLEERERQFRKWVAEAETRAQALEKWEQGLAQKQSEVESAAGQRQKAMEDAADRYERERQLWEEKISAGQMGQGDTVEAAFGAVRQEFMDLVKRMNEVKAGLLNLGDVVRDSACPGVEGLCRLYRDLAVAGAQDQRAALLADKLGMILQLDFKAEVIDPRPGDQYDPTCCERLNNSGRGSRIAYCLARGWSWNGEIKLRAVVETTEDMEVL